MCTRARALCVRQFRGKKLGAPQREKQQPTNLHTREQQLLQRLYLLHHDLSPTHRPACLLLSPILTGTRRCSLASSSQHLPNATRRFSASSRLRGYRRCRRHEHTTCTRMINDPLSPPPLPAAAGPPPSTPCPCGGPGAAAVSPGVTGCCLFAEAAACSADDDVVAAAPVEERGVPTPSASTRAMRDLLECCSEPQRHDHQRRRNDSNRASLSSKQESYGT